MQALYLLIPVVAAAWAGRESIPLTGVGAGGCQGRMISPPDLSRLTEAEKDALIPALWARVQALTARVAELEARLPQPRKTPSNSSLPPSKGHKANRPEGERRAGPRRAAPGQPGSGRRWPRLGRGARPARDRQGGGVRPLPGGAGRGRPAAARALRQGRPAAGAPGGHQGGALPRPLPVLRRHDLGARARGPGGRLAVRPVGPG